MKNWKRFLGFIAAATAVGLAHGQGVADTAVMYLVADKGSYIGGTIPDGEILLKHGEGVSFRSLGRAYDGSVTVYTGGTQDWSFSFQSPEPGPGLPGNRLQVGLYDDATRWPFNAWDSPGMSVSGNHRGLNLLSGWFNVLDVAYDTFGGMTRLAVDFRQFENTRMSGPSLYGSLRYNSQIAITSPVPEPGTALMLLAGMGLVLVGWRGRATATTWPSPGRRGS